MTDPQAGCSRIVVSRSVSPDSDLRRDWNRLVEHLDQPEVFYTHEWARAVETAFSADIQPFIVFRYVDDRLIGIAAMAIRRDDSTRACFLGAFTADYCDFISDTDGLSDLIYTTFSALHESGVTDVELGQIPKDSPTVAAVRALPHPWRSRVQDGEPCLQIQFPTQPEREAVVRAIEKKQAEKRHLKALSQIGTVGFCDLSSDESVEVAIHEIVRSHIVRFLLTDRISPLLEDARVRFLRELCSLMSKAQWLKLTVLMLNEKPISWNLGFDFEGKWFWYLPTFNPGYDPFGPGTLLLKHLLLSGTSLPQVQVVDLGLGDEFYKTRFANSSQTTRLIRLTTSFGSHYALLMRDSAVRYLKRTPALDKAVRKYASFLRKFQAKVREEGTVAILNILLRTLNQIYLQEQVLFFSPGNSAPETPRQQILKKIDWALIAECATQNGDDSGTLDYLKRAAHRLASGTTSGYAVISFEGEVLSLGWVSPRQGFHVGELNTDLEGTGFVIFDCHTPRRQRGKGYYPVLLRHIVEEFASNEQPITIFCSSRNIASIKGIKKAGFVPAIQMQRRKLLGKYLKIKEIKSSCES